jgi:hypothetical protein
MAWWPNVKTEPEAQGLLPAQVLGNRDPEGGVAPLAGAVVAASLSNHQPNTTFLE